MNQNQKFDNQDPKDTFVAPRSEVYGYLFIIAGFIFVLYSFGYFPLLNVVIGISGVALMGYGAYRIQLIHKVQQLIAYFQAKK